MVDDDDGRTDDRWTPDYGHPISSPCEPNGSGELKRGITWPYKKIRVNYLIMRNVYMKFQNPSIHCSKVSNFTEKWKNQSKFKNSIFL